jgi:hypothetical protein
VECNSISPQTKLKNMHTTRNGVSRSGLKKLSLQLALLLTEVSEIVPVSYSTLAQKNNYDKELNIRFLK